MPITVRPAVLPDEIDTVFDLPASLHRQDAAYVAPIRLIEGRRLAPTNPFFKKADFVFLLAERDGDVVGSISCMKDEDFEQADGSRLAWFGFLEFVDDLEVARALVDAASAQAGRWGATKLRGPRNLTRLEYMGLTVEGHHRVPPMLQGHHPARYSEALETLGFEKHHDVLAYETPLVDELGRPREIPDDLRNDAANCDIEGLVVRRAQWRTMRHDLLAAHEVFNEASQTVPDTRPMARESFLALGRLYLAFADAELLQLALVDGEPVGFAAAFPEVNEALQSMEGRVFPFGWLRGALGLGQVRTAAFKLIGVKQAWRGHHIHSVLIQNIVEGAQRAGYTRIDGSVIDERNDTMRHIVEAIGMDIWRRYRFYERAV